MLVAPQHDGSAVGQRDARSRAAPAPRRPGEQRVTRAGVGQAQRHQGALRQAVEHEPGVSDPVHDVGGRYLPDRIRHQASLRSVRRSSSQASASTATFGSQRAREIGIQAASATVSPIASPAQ